MSSHIDCDDLLALASCSVQEQLNADLQNQLSISLLRHIAQASANAHNACAHSTGGFAPATTPTAYAPATTPTTSNNAYFASHLASNGISSSKRRNPSLVRHADMEIVEEDYMQTENTYNYEEGNENGDEYRYSGKGAGSYSSLPFQSSTQPPSSNHNGSQFATSDPFFQAVSELQAAASSRRRLEAKPFAVSAPLQVTPNPVQFGTLNSGFNRDQNFPFYASQLPIQGNNHVQRDAALLQYR